MVAKHRTQSLSDFQSHGSEILDRLNSTGEVEALTVDGETRAVLLPPQIYAALADDIEQACHMASLKKGIEQIRNGEYLTIDEVFDPIREKLLKMKAERDAAR